jgi:hypothetical protein
MMNSNRDLAVPTQIKPLRRLIITQVVIAGLACAILIGLALTIRPLIGTKAHLESEIEEKQREIHALEEKLAVRRRELDSTEKALQDAVGKVSKATPAPQSLQKEVGSTHNFVLRTVSQKDAYVLVLASYKGFAKAITDLPVLQAKTGEHVRLLYSVSDYFVPVIGPVKSRQEAERRLEGLRSKVPDAFVSTTGAFVYEIDLGTGE